MRDATDLPAASSSGHPAAPPSLRTAAALVGLQGTVLVGTGVFFAVETVVAESFDELGAWLIGVMALVAGVVVLLVARGLLAARPWARSPALLVQVLSLPVGIQLLQGGRWYLGVPALVVALVAGWCLFAPATGRALVRPPS